MKLIDIVAAITNKNNVTNKDIEQTVLYLLQDTVLDDVKTLRRIAKKVNEIMEYEDAVC